MKLVYIFLGSKFAPYYDTFLEERTDLRTHAAATGQLEYHLAFVSGGHAGCVPTWGAKYDIDDPVVLDPIRELQAQGARMIVATG